MRGLRFYWLLSLPVLSGLAADAPLSSIHVRNFAVVNEHLLRGGEPTDQGLTELQSAGVKVVIDLRESGPTTAIEKRTAERLGMQYTNVPLPPLSAPSPAQLRSVLDLLAQHNEQIIFLHCHRGKDRTGTVVACYRVQHDGWDNARALDEARRFGMSTMEHSMHTFILRFTPATNAADPVLLTH